MKILLCTSTFRSITHGPAKFVNLMMDINKLYPQHEIRILTQDVESTITDLVYKVKRKLPPVPFGVFWVYKDNYIYYKAAMRVKEEYDYDVLLFNNIILGWKTARQRKRDFKTMGMLNDDEYLRRGLLGLSIKKEWWIDMSRKPLERLACQAMDRVITNSKYLNNAVVKAYHLDQEKVIQLYKSVNLSEIEFKNDQIIDTDKEIKILFVKNDFKRGGLLLLTEALGKLTEYTFRLIIAGPQASDKAIIDQYFGGKENLLLDFRGPMSQKEVYSEMYFCDIFCVPAFREALGVANIEALAAGIPVVSSNAGGIPEVLGDGAYGWISEKENLKSLVLTLKECIEKPALRKRKSKQGRTHVESVFSHTSMLKKIVKEIMLCLET